MGRTTTLVISSLLLIGGGSLAQQSAPQTPEDAFSNRELIAWSQLQIPQPAPQPLPPKDTQVPQPEQPRDQQPKAPADPHVQQEPLAFLIGMIIRDSNRYFLSVADRKIYQLDLEDDLRRYENQKVRISGNLNASSETIQVLRVDPF